MIADLVVVTALHYMERGMKAEKALREMQAKEDYNKKHDDDKATKSALKQAQRDEQKRAQQRMKADPKANTAHINLKINQPDKKK